MEIEDRLLADPYLPKPARFAFVTFCTAMVGALALVMGLIWFRVVHTLSWPWIVLRFGYLGWIVWSD